MDLGQSLYAELAGNAGLQSAIGTSSGVFPQIIPQGQTLPAVTYSQVSMIQPHSFVTDPNLRMAREQVSSWSTSYKQAKAVALAVRSCLQDFTGSLGSGVTVQRVFFDDEIDLEEVDPVTEQLTYQIAQDYIIWYST